jgi:REP element-mobilizing transposase RayT
MNDEAFPLHIPDDEARPHGHALRKGRVSVAGRVYFVTSNVRGRQPCLVPSAREVVIGALRWSRDQGRLRLLGYVVMDDHFHFLLMLVPGYPLERLLSSLKGFTSKEINREAGRTGEFWQEGYHDHAIRDAADFEHHLRYMHNNPVRRGLVERPEDYAWSTAHPSRASDIEWDALGF